MSEPRSDSEPCWPEDLGGEPTVVRRYRFGARTLLRCRSWQCCRLQSSARCWREINAPRNVAGSRPGTTCRQAKPAKLDKIQWPEISPNAHDRDKPSQRSFKTFSEKDQASPFSRARGVIAEFTRAIEHEAVDRAFAQLDQNDSRRVRTFLTAYGANAYARQQGYVEAVRRGVREAGLYASGEIVSCGKCWCWQSKPAHAGPPTLTD